MLYIRKGRSGVSPQNGNASLCKEPSTTAVILSLKPLAQPFLSTGVAPEGRAATSTLLVEKGVGVEY